MASAHSVSSSSTSSGTSLAMQIVLPCVVLVVLILGAVQVTRIAESQFKQVVQDQLEELSASTRAGLEIWLNSREQAVGLVASQDNVVVECKTLIDSFNDNPNPKGIQGSDSFSRLNRALIGAASRYGTGGFVLINDKGVTVAASHPGLIGTRAPHDQAPDGFETALGGTAIVTRPFRSAYAAHRLRKSAQLRATMFAFAPIKNQVGDTLGVLGLRLEPREGFSKVLLAARLGKSGEVYLADEQGRMLTVSRFEDDLVRYGLLARGESSVLGISIRNPNVDLAAGDPVELPVKGNWTKAMAGLRAARTPGSRKSGVLVEGYRDYRGVDVVGAWHWIDRYKIGLIAEIDQDEAFGGMNIVRNILIGTVILLALSLGANSFGSVFVARLRRRMERNRQLGQYTLEKKIGAGGMGQIYLARHALLKRPTALKVMESAGTTKEDRLRFEREVQLTSQLTHPNTIAIYDYGHTPDGVFYYVMEHLEGLDLQTLVNTFGPCPPGRVVRILDQVCASLEEAHEQGLIHRDIKPANVFLCERGGMPDVVKVLDFGLVKSLDEGSVALTKHEALSGTPGYLAPEVIRQPKSAGVPSDLYCVAAIGYFLTTGSPVFSGDSVMDILDKHMHQAPAHPSTRLGAKIPKGLETLLMQCLEKDPDKRVKSATEFRMRLKHADASWHERLAHAWWDAHREQIRLMHEPKVEADKKDALGALATIEIARTR